MVIKMENYLIEIHSHTKETSNCGEMVAAKAVKVYISKGYSGMMITDHLHSYTFKRKMKLKIFPSWDDKIDCFLKGYRAAMKEAVKHENFKVYLGAELRFDENDNDYLVFGLTEEKLRRMDGVLAMETEDGIRFVQSLGCTVVQAHPFRNHCMIVPPGILDGIEIFNGHPGHDSRNDIATYWAEKFDYKIRTGGSDFHGEYEPNSGIYTEILPQNEAQLQQIIVNNQFTIKYSAIEKNKL